MAIFIQSINAASATVTPGERRLGQRLNSYLEDDYLVWFNVPVGRTRRYPDYVVLHPRRGLLVLEVKDWKISDFLKFSNDRWEVQLAGKRQTVASPLEQARQYMIEIVNQLQVDPQLRETEGNYYGKLVFPYGWGVVFPNITRKQWNELLSEHEQDLILPARRLICQDEMQESTDPMIFQEKLWGMFEYDFKRTMTLPQIDRVRWHLFPEVRIDERKQAELFEEEEIAPDLIKVLDMQQEQLARNLGKGHRVIHGVAGSGKTLILGYRCVQLADTLALPVLVLCYNVSLAARLKHFIEAKGLSEKVHIRSFHEWCGEMLRAYQAPLRDGDGEHWERQVESVIEGVEIGLIPRAQYGAVMIDEGHDFEPQWLKLVVQMVDPATDSFLLLYDDAQSIYRKKKGLGFSLSSVGVKAAGRTTILRLNYRNSREILKFAYDFAKGSFGSATADEDHIPLIEPESAGISRSKPAFKMLSRFADECDYAIRCVNAWRERGVPANEIAIICFQEWQGEAVSAQLANRRIAHLWTGAPGGKKSYDPSAEKITVITAQSSKGLEFQSVIVLGTGVLNDEEDVTSDLTRLLYVAMTRAKRQLAVSASAENRFTRRLKELGEVKVGA
ncbi:3'-5' exonuclease [Luteolibacter algae]|uniref:DNA 3'-5' helicase n=1 Tax=Luteolibacter algae TaxID=454151 RepID=A0ABW5D6G1_9BACT